MRTLRKGSILLLIAGLLVGCAELPIRPPPLIPLPTPDYTVRPPLIPLPTPHHHHRQHHHRYYY
jgi:hypothetical protein